MGQDETRTPGGPGVGPGGVGKDADAGEDGTLGPELEGGAVDDGAAPSAALAEAAAQVVEDVYELRLTALLHQLVRTRGYKGAGRVLDVDPRTVTTSVRQGMSRRVREQVERMLVDKDGGARDVLEEAVGELSGQVGGLQIQVSGLESELREGMKALGETHSQGMRRLEQRLALGQIRVSGLAGLPGPAPVSLPPRRRYPDLVTPDPAEDDEEVFGLAAGRGVAQAVGRASRPGPGSGLGVEAAADSGGGGGPAGGARADPAAGAGAAQGPGPGRPVELAGEGAR